MKVFVFDSERCNGCYNCQLACKDEMVGNEWMPFSKPQPDTGQFWCHMKETTHGQIPKVKVEYRLVRNCHTQELLDAAGDAAYRTEDGFVILDPEKSKGRKDLVKSFPETVFWNEELQIPQACTGCAHLVGQGRLPHCVDHCPTGALSFGEKDEMDLTDCVPAEAGGNYYYRNLPGLFIAGDVWDSEADEIIEDANVALIDSQGTEIADERTDGFGDFWFKKLQSGKYRVVVEASGFKRMEKSVDLRESTNIGDFPLSAE